MAALAPLLLSVLAATISPGGATTLATVSGANLGFRRSLPLILCIASGLASMAALGLAGVLLAAPSLALAMKAVGSAYLLWLAWQTARGRRTARATRGRSASSRASGRSGTTRRAGR